MLEAPAAADRIASPQAAASASLKLAKSYIAFLLSRAPYAAVRPERFCCRTFPVPNHAGPR